jgi:flavin-binding protein dodecin
MVRSWHRPSQPRLQEVIVAGTVARVTEISARSDTSFEDAVKVALDRANATLRGVTAGWVKEQSVDVENGAIVAYRVNLLVTFVLE